MSHAIDLVDSGGRLMPLQMTSYTLEEHRHRFASWVAARAAQRGFATTGQLAASIDACGIRSALRRRSTLPESASSFDRFQRRHCQAIIGHLDARGLVATYGRAAKLLAVYLKCTELLGDAANSPLATVMHPPIDRRLLQGIASDRGLPTELRAACRVIAWTALDESSYFELIDSLRFHGLHRPAFWMLERYWTIAATSTGD